METSRSVPHSTDSTPRSAQALKALDPGLMTSSAPAKPVATAVQRRHPTCSPRNRAEAAVKLSGVICKMPIRSANGMRARAAWKNRALPTSPTLRQPMARTSASLSR